MTQLFGSRYVFGPVGGQLARVINAYLTKYAGRYDNDGKVQMVHDEKNNNIASSISPIVAGLDCCGLPLRALQKPSRKPHRHTALQTARCSLAVATQFCKT